MTAHGDGDFQFRAYAVDAGHKNGFFHALEIRPEEAAKASDSAEHLRTIGGTDNRLNLAA